MTGAPQDTILVVDDAQSNVAFLVDVLGDDYDVSVALDGPSAIEEALVRPPDLVLLDIIMPGMDGYEVCRRLQAEPVTQGIPVIFLTAMGQVDAKTRGFRMGAVDYVTKPFNAAELLARVRTHLALRRAQRSLERQNVVLEKAIAERTREVVLTRDVTIHALASLAETRDAATGAHISRTQGYVRMLAEELSTSPRFPELADRAYRDLLHKSAPLHDIGKVAVPDHILLKPGPLTADEFAEMKKHTIYGRDALMVPESWMGTSRFLRVARQLIYSHHERWDGRGYPEGIRGTEIPLSGRIMAVADVYDALVSERVYKAAMPHAVAMQTMAEGEGTQFDPEIISAFLRCEPEVREIAVATAGGEPAYQGSRLAVRNQGERHD